MQLINMAFFVKDYVRNLFEREEGQDFFEYLLIIAGISLVILVAAAFTVPDLFNEVLNGVCGAINGITGITVDCSGIVS
jgi:Flp pilus assembly pilin Flp